MMMHTCVMMSIDLGDRFIRDQEFRNRMIENHRDEDLCRRWDALADEDHSHHLTAQEYPPLQEEMVASFKLTRF